MTRRSPFIVAAFLCAAGSGCAQPAVAVAELDVELLGEVLAGGLDKIREAGAALAGGHSVRDHEIKYGLAGTGGEMSFTDDGSLSGGLPSAAEERHYQVFVE